MVIRRRLFESVADTILTSVQYFVIKDKLHVLRSFSLSTTRYVVRTLASAATS